MRLLSILPVPPLLILAACGQDAPRDPPENVAAVPSRPDPAPVDAVTPPAPIARQEPDPAGLIPARFRGRWAGLGADCADERSDLRLSVLGDELHFYESVGKVAKVVVHGAGALVVDAAYEGEGQAWDRRQTLSLSPDGQRLTIVTEGVAMVRKRCAADPG